MLEILGGIISSILGGGVTGLAGVAIQRYFDHKNKRLDMDHEITLKRLDMEIMDKEFASRVQVVETEADAKVMVASYNEPQLYSQGLKANSWQTSLMFLLDFFRGIIRPGLTLALFILVVIIYFQAKNLIGIPMEAAQAYRLLERIIDTVLYLSTTTLLWWFGVRNKQPRR